MTLRFWLLQAVGWSFFLLIAFIARPTEDAVPLALQALAVLAVSAVGLLASLLLRTLYRWLQADGYGELRWLGILLVASIAAAVGVDAVVYAGLALVADLSPGLTALHDAQPMISRAPLLVPAFIAWSLLYLAISRQTRLAEAARLQNDLRLALKEAQLQRLLGHISPHFTFNTLNNIRALILLDPALAREQITRFASTLRYQFTGGEQALVPLQDEMDVVRDYLSLVGLQLGKRMRSTDQIDAAALAVPVPRFCVQLLVENAIKHGLGPSRTGGTLHVQASLRDGMLRVEVRNTGRLAPADSANPGTGLANLLQRLHLSFGAQAGLRLVEEGDEVVATLWIGSAA